MQGFSWKGRFPRHCNGAIWSTVPSCIVWVLWKERNNHTFKGLERSLVELKLVFLCTLYEWMAALGGHSFSHFWISLTVVLFLDFPSQNTLRVPRGVFL